jgi:hypothetical protein
VNDLDNDWARSQVEAAADSSLSPSDAARFREAMAGDESLRQQLQRSLRLKRDLEQLRTTAVPRGLLRKLLGIPAASAARRPVGHGGRLVAASVGVVVAAAAIALLLPPNPPQPSVDEQARAVADFELAMSYLRESTEIANSEVTAALGDGLRRALHASRDTPKDEQPTPGTGD